MVYKIQIYIFCIYWYILAALWPLRLGVSRFVNRLLNMPGWSLSLHRQDSRIEILIMHFCQFNLMIKAVRCDYISKAEIDVQVLIFDVAFQI